MKLPSTQAAEDFVDGKGAHRVVLTTAGRVAIIGAAGYAAGARGDALLRTAIAGAVVIELLVLGYAFMSRPKTNA